MAKFDIKMLAGSYGVAEFRAEDQSTASNRSAVLEPGELVKRAGTGNNFADIIADGDPAIGSDTLIGVVLEQSTDTSSADGFVLVQMVGGGTWLRGNANDSSNMNTTSSLNGLKLDQVAADVDGSNNITIDENEGDATNHGFTIIDGDTTKGTLDVTVNNRVTLLGREA